MQKMMSLLASNTHMRTVTYVPASSDARASASVHEDKKIAPARRACEMLTRDHVRNHHHKTAIQNSTTRWAIPVKAERCRDVRKCNAHMP